MPDELTTPDTREKLASQIPAVELLMKLGFRYLPPTEALQARGGRKSEVLLTPILREQLTKLNRDDAIAAKRLWREAKLQGLHGRLRVEWVLAKLHLDWQ